MRIVHHIDLIGDTAQERLPDYTAEFPCITTRAELHCYPESHTPWHWHPTAELFYMAEGSLDFHLPDQTLHFAQGCGGLLLPNVPHSTSWRSGAAVVTLLHLFDPEFLFGKPDSRMAQKYLSPILNDPQRAMLILPAEAPVLHSLRASFELRDDQWVYEYRLREALCDLWLQFQTMDSNYWRASQSESKNNLIRKMILFIQTHLSEDLNVRRLSDSMHISERACYRIFRDSLHTSPNRYIQELRIRRACALLCDPAISITEAALKSGFDDIGYFGRLFRKEIGISPTEYQKRQNNPN